MKVYKGASASPGLVLGQVSRLERHVETFSDGPFNPEREQRMLDEAIHTAQTAGHLPVSEHDAGRRGHDE